MKAPEQSWLLRQLEGWEAEGLVTADSAKVLRERFKAQSAASAGTGALMLGIVGALLLGAVVFVFGAIAAMTLFAVRKLHQRH